ncbi:MAG: SufE family protein [Bacteroidia bacterium]|nr:SufE family protein [Bacteroidia bacterium]
MKQSILDTESEIIEEFEMFDDWTDKYQYIIDMGKSLQPLSDNEKTEQNLVRGCQSQVWLTAHTEGENVVFQADSDAIITKGLIALLVKVLSGNTPDEILAARLEFMDKIGIREHLSPTRANGLNAMVTKMKAYALGLKSLKG